MRKEKEACFTSILKGSFLLLVDWRTLKEYTAYPYGMRSWGEWADVPFNQTPFYNLNSIAHRLVLALKYFLFFFASLCWSIVFLSFSIKQTIVIERCDAHLMINTIQVRTRRLCRFLPSTAHLIQNLLTLHEPVNIDRILVICSVGDQPPFSTEPYIFAAAWLALTTANRLSLKEKRKKKSRWHRWHQHEHFRGILFRQNGDLWWNNVSTTGLAYFFVTRVSATASTTKGSLKTFVSWGRCICSGSGYTDFIIPTEMPLMVTYAILKQIKQQVHFDGQRLLFFLGSNSQTAATKIWTNMCNPQEMERKRDLIRQIRALEKVPVEKYKQLGGLRFARGCTFIFIHFRDFKYRSLQMKPEFHQIGFWDAETMFKSYVQTWQARKRLWKLDNNSRYIHNLNQVYMDFWQFQFPLSVQYSRADFGSAQISWSQVLRSW